MIGAAEKGGHDSQVDVKEYSDLLSCCDVSRGNPLIGLVCIRHVFEDTNRGKPGGTKPQRPISTVILQKMCFVWTGFIFSRPPGDGGALSLFHFRPSSLESSALPSWALS